MTERYGSEPVTELVQGRAGVVGGGYGLYDTRSKIVIACLSYLVIQFSSLKNVNHACPINTDHHAVRHSQHRNILNKIQMALQELLLLETDHRAPW